MLRGRAPRGGQRRSAAPDGTGDEGDQGQATHASESSNDGGRAAQTEAVAGSSIRRGSRVSRAMTRRWIWAVPS